MKHLGWWDGEQIVQTPAEGLVVVLEGNEQTAVQIGATILGAIDDAIAEPDDERAARKVPGRPT